jgi:hypothetical protein
VPVLDDPEEHRGPQVLLGLPALERGGEVVGVAVLDQEIDALGRELALGDLEQVEDDVPALDRVGLLDELEEVALELDRDLLGDGRQVAQVGDQRGLRGLEGRMASTPATLAMRSRTAAP